MSSFPAIPEGLGYPLVDMDTYRLPTPVIEAIAESPELGTTIAAATAGVDGLVGWGHSMMDAGWIVDLAAELGVPGFDGGESGTASSQIAMRQGGLTPLLTFPGNSLSATTAATTVTIAPASSWRGSFGHGGVLILSDGTEIPGTLTIGTGPTFTFSRTTAGSAVDLGGPVRFRMKTGDAYRAWAQVYWVGVNNLLAPGARLLDAVPDIEAMARHQIGQRRVLILADIPTTSQVIGTDAFNQLRAEYEALVTFWGEACVIDVNSELVNHGLELAGINPTTTDRTDLVGGVAPTSLRSDGFHPNTPGYAVVKALAGQRIRELGWFPGAGRPVDLPAQPTGLTAGTATTSTQPLTWAAAARADGYRVEYRPSGSSGAWALGAVSATTAATVETLLEETAYEYRVVAYNEAGGSIASATIAATTAGTAPVVRFSDTFTRGADAALTGSTADGLAGGSTFVWQGTGGNARASAGKVYRPSADSSVRTHYMEAGQAAQAASIIVAGLGVANSFGLVLRFGSTTDLFNVIIGPDANIYATSRRPGDSASATLPGTANGIVENGDELKASFVGDTYRVFVNGVQVLQGTRTGHAGTGIGLRLSTPAADYFTAPFKVYDK